MSNGGRNMATMPVVRWSKKTAARLMKWMKRRAFGPEAEKQARLVLDDIRRRGDVAVARWSAKHDRAALSPSQWRVQANELRDARRAVDGEFRRALGAAVRRVEDFARAGMRDDWTMRGPAGETLGEKFVPFDRVGVYVPGGAAPLASTAVMTVTLARAAGVREIVACTPPEADGGANPYLLCALDRAGATEIYKVGGIQAVGMLAYGTRTVKAVQKIVGPGGPYVTAAKRQVYGEVSLDMVAGPSEIAILADETAEAGLVAADLLSQAEHGTGEEKAVLVTTSAKLARAAVLEVRRQAAGRSRRAAIGAVLKRGAIAVVVDSVGQGVEVCNMFAPEHLELMVRDPEKVLKSVKRAGAVFLGRWTPEVAGDFAAGPSHVLPTGGTAAMFSGLTVDDFRRRISVMKFSRRSLAEVLPVVEAFGRVEGLDAHVESARARFRRT